MILYSYIKELKWNVTKDTFGKDATIITYRLCFWWIFLYIKKETKVIFIDYKDRPILGENELLYRMKKLS